jgi:hypothetical protein
MWAGVPICVCLIVNVIYLVYSPVCGIMCPWCKLQGATVQLCCLAQNDAFVGLIDAAVTVMPLFADCGVWFM